jgi:hypothetical protein
MKKTTLYILFIITIIFTGYESVYSANEIFRSNGSGNWNTASTWQVFFNGNWVPASSTPDQSSSTITITVGDVVTVTENVTADQIALGGTISINDGVTLTYPGNGATFTVAGTISGTGTLKVEGSLAMDLKSYGVFSAGLRIASGTVVATDFTSPRIGRLYGPVTVDSGATLSPSMTGNVNVYHLEFYGNFTNNGTLTAAGGNGTGAAKSMRFKGPEFVNNGGVSTLTAILDSNMTLSGTGSFSPSRLYVGANGNVTMLSNITFSPTTDFNFISGGILDPNGFTANLTSAGLTLNSGATITNSGLVRTQNSVFLNLRAGSNFNAPLNVSSGVTSATDYSAPFTGRLYGPVSVDAGATLAPTMTGNVTVHHLEFYGNVTNNGTLTAAGGNGTGEAKSMRFKGPEFVNNGGVSTLTAILDTNLTLSGTGSFSPSRLYVGANGNVTMLSNITFSPTTDFNFISGGILDPNGFTANLTSAGLTLNSGATIINSGLVRTQNTVSLNLRAGSNFNAPLNVSSGVTSATDYSAPYTGRLYGHVTVDAGATLAPTMTGNVIVYHLEIYGNITNNGTLTAGGGNGTDAAKSIRFKGLQFVNNGLVSTLTVNLDTNITLSGTGSFITNANILSNRIVTLTTNHQFSSVVINTGSTFNIGSNLVKFTASNPIIQNGIFVNTGSKIEYNGTALQSVSVSNINYYGLRINNSTGATLLGNVTVNDTLSVILGGLNLNGKIITITPDGYMTETPGNTVFGTTGYITTTRDVGAPSSLNVGGLGAVLTASSNLGSTEIRRGHTVQNGLNGGTSIKRYYDITPTNNSGLDATLVFKFDDSELNLKPEPLLKLFKSTNSGSTWQYMGGSVNISSNEITLSGLTSFSRWSADSSEVSAAITTLMQGFYDNVTNKLSMSDTVRAYLRNSFAPYSVVDSSIGIIDSLTFKSSFMFPNAADGNYYIQLKHRNSLETWSKFGVNYMMDTTLNYDFTFAATQSYGNNTILKGSKYCMYSGDVTQDGYIDLADVVNIYNNATAFANGYVVTDVNGDLITDLADVLIGYNNAIAFVSAKYPTGP